MKAFRRPLAFLAVSVFCLSLVVSLVVVFHALYFGDVNVEAAGIRFQSTGLFRPLLVAVASWLALGRFLPRVRPSRDALVVAACLLVYAIPPTGAPSGDTVPSLYTALSMVTGRGTSLDGYPELVERGRPYYLIETPLGLRSEFSNGPEILAWPIFLPAPFSNLPRPQLLILLGRVSAMVIGLCSVWLAIQVIERLDSPCSPRLLGLAYGLGTSHWAVSSSALWQHGPGEVWMLGALDRLLDRDLPLTRRLVAMGACLTLAAFTRPPLGLPTLLLAISALYLYRGRAIVAYLSAGLLALPLVLHNLNTYGSALGAYASRTGGMSPKPVGELIQTMSWLLLSPNRGALWYQPVVIISLLAGLFLFWKASRRWAFCAGLGGFLLTLALAGNYSLWWGGYSFGPRYVTDALPWWILAVGSLGAAGAWFRRSVVGLTVVGVLINLAGTLGEPTYWDTYPSIDRFPDRLHCWSDSQIEQAALTAAPWSSSVRLARHAETRGDLEQALRFWNEESERGPWRRFAAYRVTDLLLRNDRLPEALSHIEKMVERWPDSSYVRFLSLRVPTVARILESQAWIPPVSIQASRMQDLAKFAHDGTVATNWTTAGGQRATDWLELFPPPGVLVRGVTVISAPEFGQEPIGLHLVGKTETGETISLGLHEHSNIPWQGWVTMRFPAVRLDRLRLLVTEADGDPRPWTVSEARLLVAQ